MGAPDGWFCQDAFFRREDNLPPGGSKLETYQTAVGSPPQSWRYGAVKPKHCERNRLIIRSLFDKPNSVVVE